MTDLDEGLARALDEAVPPPPHDLDPESLRGASPPERRPRLLAPVLTAAAMVAVAVTIAALAGPNTSPRPPSTPFGPVSRSGVTSAPPPGPVANPQQITARAVTRLLAKVPSLPGAKPVDHAPVPVLRKPMTEWAGNRVHRTRWWLASGSVVDALAYFTAHPAAGTKSSGSSSAGGPNGTTEQGLSFAASGPEWERPTVYTGLEVDVAVAPAPGGVAIRVDVQAAWLPQRTAAEHIPNDVTSVDVVVVRGDPAATVRRTLNAADARSLAAVVNGLPVDVGHISCPLMVAGSDTLTFHSAAGDVRVDAGTSGCQVVTVGPRSAHNPALSGGGAVDQAVLRALGLPPH